MYNHAHSRNCCSSCASRGYTLSFRFPSFRQHLSLQGCVSASPCDICGGIMGQKIHGMLRAWSAWPRRVGLIRLYLPAGLKRDYVRPASLIEIGHQKPKNTRSIGVPHLIHIFQAGSNNFVFQVEALIQHERASSVHSSHVSQSSMPHLLITCYYSLQIHCNRPTSYTTWRLSIS
jgi:hypothetical protein